MGRGNVLIVQNDLVPQQSVEGFFDLPNDDDDGGELAFDFLRPVEPVSLVLIDIDIGREQASTVALTDALGRQRTYTVPPQWTEDLQREGPPAWRVLDLTTLAPQPGFLSNTTAVEDTGFDPTRVTRLFVQLGSSGAVDELVVR